MRLIDADILLSSGYPTVYHTEYGDEVINTEDIKTAPTVEPDKPQGKWVVDICENVDFMTRRGWRCSVCGTRQTYGITKYCPYCGAQMSKEGDK